VALRHAPPVEANLVNYLWPLLIVVLAPLWLPGTPLRAVHVVAGLVGFAGAGLAILGGRGSANGGFAWGYLPALGSAFIWASYSLATRRLAERGQAFPTAAIGLFGLVSGVLSLACHVVLEPAVVLATRDFALIAAMGLGPLGAAFFLWDRALKAGDPRTIGVLSYLTPIGSTALLALVTGRAFTLQLGVAAAMVIGAAVIAVRTK
jgi:drug/metabolite transporter (DMT)-like permease